MNAEFSYFRRFMSDKKATTVFWYHAHYFVVRMRIAFKTPNSSHVYHAYTLCASTVVYRRVWP